MDRATLTAYRQRIGAPDDADLAALQASHLRAVPFENLSVHLGEPIVLDEAALVAKLVDRRRGGFCYELNGAFALLLEASGYRVERLAAKVVAPDGTLGPPFDHMTLLVHDGPHGPDGPILVDVGFGRFSALPLRWGERGDQADPVGRFRLVDVAGGRGDVDVLLDDQPLYRIERRPRDLPEFIPTCWWQQTSPASHFTRSLTCSIVLGSGSGPGSGSGSGSDRVTLSGDRLIRTVAGERTEEVLSDDGAILAAYRTHFGIELDRVPRVS